MNVMNPKRVAFQLRPAGGGDLPFAWLLYRDLMKPLTVELLEWNEPGQKHVVEEALALTGSSIIVVDGSQAGWLHVDETPDSIYLGQLYVVPSLQNCGIGTAVVRQLSNKALKEGKSLTLEVMKNSRARSLYERLGFRVIGESKYKLKMQWQNDALDQPTK